jgi:hypothetical protein
LEESRQGELPPHQRKYSQALLELRRCEKAQLQNRNFSGAGEFKRRADQLEKEETTLQMLRWQNDIDIKIANAKVAYAKLVRVRKDYWRSEELLLVSDANKQVMLAELAIAHLERNLQSAQERMAIATTLKEETERVAHRDPVATGAGVPQLYTGRSSQKEIAGFRQRQILNHKIYTRLPKRGAQKRGRANTM